ncbi:hypothetical protein VOA_002036 [Vibrio sp. RC586]|uniref:hypothetical protein n=1 Tax=Vibrio sp. RC586 TaxID=675815 RepID=UPI0001BB8402|nr:hypothetical protein [Vibrio sp. RC586]EEY98218.1 hypothetical protein VOA_002036 [Vibrio sp. RC586]
MKNKKVAYKSIVSVVVASMATFVSANENTETAISISKVGMDSIGEVIAHGASNYPTAFSKVSGYASIASVAGSIAQKLTNIAVQANISKKCKSTNSYNELENVCEYAPSFQENRFCVVNVDNKMRNSARFETVKWESDYGTLGEVLTKNTVKHKEELCISRSVEPIFLEIYNSSNKKTFSRPIPLDLFNGEFGGIVKNGTFHLKRKVNKFHDLLGYHLCPDIMYNSSGFNTQDALARRCLDRLKEKEYGTKNNELDKLFTRTMADQHWSSLYPQFDGKFNDEYIMKNAGIDTKSHQYSARIGGLFILKSDTYVFIDPSVNSARKEGGKLDDLVVYNDFYITGHTVGKGSIANMGSKISSSSLGKIITENNSLF